MINQFKLSLLASFFALSAIAAAAATLPYHSELGTPYGIDSDWLNSRGNGPKAWQYFTGDFGGQWGNTGCSSGVQYIYGNSQADAWLISPDFDLKANTDYYLTVWVRTEFYPECFCITMAQSQSVDALRQGPELIDFNEQVVNDRWKQLRKTFRVAADGTYNFGLNCYSAPDRMKLYVTGFSLVEGDGTHPVEVIPATEPQTMALPYKASLPADVPHWSGIRGTTSTGPDNWYYEEADNSFAFLAPDEKEDNWLVSPALNFAEAGTYKITVSAESYGVLDWFLGTDPADPDSFTRPLGGTSYPGTTGATVVTIDNPGIYHVGFHAHADDGSTMGYGVYALHVRQIKDWPQPIVDLTTKADPNGALKVDLAWTNPVKTLMNNNLAELQKVEIYRDGALAATLTGMLPGQKCTYTDTQVPAQGIHAYHILAYNQLGTSEEDFRDIETMWVGAPVEAFPYSWTTASDRANYEALTHWVAETSGTDPDHEWHIEYGWRYAWSSRSTTGTNDDFVATPYIALEKGYYKITFDVNDRNANYDFGYATDRADLRGTFTKVQEFRQSDIWNNHTNTAVISVPADGNYALAWHHVAGTATYSGVDIYSVAMQKINPLPGIAEDLAAEPAPNFALGATLTWRNPATDNAGYPLADLKKVAILRNSENIAVIQTGVTPGATMSYTDNTVPNPGEFTYTVQVFNQNGMAQAMPASTTVYIGPGEAIPYQAALQDWTRHNLDRDNIEWQNTTGGGITIYARYWDTSDMAVSPYVCVDPAKTYEITLEVSTSTEADVMWNLCTGHLSQPSAMKTLTMVTIPASAGRHAQTFDYCPADYEPVPAGACNRVFAAHAVSSGTIVLHSFRIAEKSTGGISAPTGNHSTIALQGNTIVLPGGTETARVYDTQGRMLCSTSNTLAIDATALPKGILIVEAYGNYGRTIARIAR